MNFKVHEALKIELDSGGKISYGPVHEVTRWSVAQEKGFKMSSF